MIMKWKYAIMKVLYDNPEPMHYGNVANEVITKSLRDKFGATPANTVNVLLFKHKDVFEYVDSDDCEGWRLKQPIDTAEQAEMEKQFLQRMSILNDRLQSENGIIPQEDFDSDESDDESLNDNDSQQAQKQTNFVTSRGYLWRRDSCQIKNGSLMLLGLQNTKDPNQYIDFTDQVGVYVLLKDFQPIYVGQALKQSLGVRLFQHTRDRFQFRWNRFSWYGIYNISEDKSLDKSTEQKYTTEALINGLEGVLIDVIEASNSKSGNGMSGTQYFQFMIEEISRLDKVSVGRIVEEFYGDLADREGHKLS